MRIKAKLFALFVFSFSLLGAEPKVVSLDKIQSRGEVGSQLAYIPNQDTPFSGKAVNFHPNGQKKQENNYKDGKRDGLWTSWYDNGIKRVEANYKDGKQDGFVNAWYNNSLLKEKSSYSNGKIVSAFVWKPNGEKCPATNVKNGNGVKLWYILGSTQVDRITYKDGERVRD